MRPFEQAWCLLKAPYDVYSYEGYKKEPFEGTLYAGGDVADTPKYYTPSLEGALDYAVYGSATGDVPMRETSPVIRVVQDPGFDEKGQPAGLLIADPQLRDAYMQDDDSPLQSELMDDDTLRQLISQMSDKSPRTDTTGYYHSQQDRNKHIQGALERLKNKTSGRLSLTGSEKEIGGISTGRHDELDMMDFDDINSGWDFLEDWERSWLLANRFDELPMWVQERYQDDVKTGEPMDLAFRLLKMPLYHGTTRERAEQIMREGLKPTSHAPQLFEMEPEEIRAAMIEAGRDPADYERLFGGDWNFAYGDQSGREPAISDAALYGGDDPAVIEIDENHPDAPQFMLEPYYPEIEDSDLDFFHDPLSQGFNRLKNQMRSNQTVPPSAMRILQPEEIPPSQLDLLKAPVYTDDNPPPMQQSRHYKMLPYLDQMGGYMWQSEDGMARGTMRPDYFLNSLLINNFEMAGPVRGQNKSRQYIQDMIDQGHEHFDHELDGTHVTNVERHSAGYWNKLVDEGVLDGAHERPNIRTNLDGDQHFVYAYDKESKQPWSHELSEDYADYHDLPTDAVYDEI